MNILTILPVSRMNYLDRVVDSLDSQTHPVTDLLVVVDRGGVNKSEVETLFADRDVKYNINIIYSVNPGVSSSVLSRRLNIANIHNQIRDYVGGYEWVFSVEDDGVLPADALEKLVLHTKSLVDIGMITGVELGRWGLKYVGAWSVDNVHNPSKITSLQNKASKGGVEEIDGCGLYCALIRADMYRNHEFFVDNGLGPDVNLGLYLRQQGMRNYIDWTIHVSHLTRSGDLELEIKATDDSKSVAMIRSHHNIWQQRY